MGKFNVGIIGSGHSMESVGWASAWQLCALYDVNDLQSILLYNRTKQFSDLLSRSINFIANTKEKDLRAIASGIDDIRDSCEIVLVSIDGNANWKERAKKGEITRSDVFEKNRSALESIATSLEGYEGTIIMATNPTDILCDYFSHVAGIDPQRIVGVAPETGRFRTALIEVCESDLGYGRIKPEGFVIGPHNENAIPLYSTVKIDSVPLSHLTISDKLKSPVFKKAHTYMTDALQISGTTSDWVATDVCELVKAIRDETSTVCASVFIHDVHLGYPTKFKNGKSQLVELQLTGDEEMKFNRLYQQQKRLVDQQRLTWNGSVSIVKKRMYTQDEMELILKKMGDYLSPSLLRQARELVDSMGTLYSSEK